MNLIQQKRKIVAFGNPGGPVQRDSSKETSNTITIDADEHTTANVTLGGVNIDAGSRGNNTAGIRTMGDGNVTIELDGNNSVNSAADAAGLQKENGGNLTIKDGNTPAGRLEATGGIGGAGIGLNRKTKFRLDGQSS